MATAMALATPATVKQVFFLVDGRTGLALMADGGRLRFFSTYNAADGAYFCVGAVLHILQVLPHDGIEWLASLQLLALGQCVECLQCAPLCVARWYGVQWPPQQSFLVA